MNEDEEFKGRDARGLLPKGNSEADARNFYWILFGKLLLCQAPAMALVAQLGASALLPGQAEAVALRLAFVREHGLGFVYVAWYIVYATKVYLTLNANGARGPARLDRPDQHIYKVMARHGDLAGEKAPFVLMATTGAAGRFNRAQRAASNMDETLPLFITGLLLVAATFGPVVLLPTVLSAYGRVAFANGYKEALANRSHGFLPAAVAEHLSAALVGAAAIRTFSGF